MIIGHRHGRKMNKSRTYSTVLLILLILAGSALSVGGQTPAAGNSDPPEVRARQAMDRGDSVQAISILNTAIADHPTPEIYLTLGSIYRRTRDFQKAEDTLAEAMVRYPNDPRIPFELANVYLAAGDADSAREQLHRALQIDPKNADAADLLAAIELSEGEVQTALHYWNATGFPIVNNVLHNTNVGFGHWTVREANAFKIGELMTYGQWRTTQRRLYNTQVFSNVGVAVEPAPAPGRYNPVILTTDRKNDLFNILFGIVKGSPYETAYLDYWDIGDSGISLNSSYRWNFNRKRGEAHLYAPLPLPGILFLHSAGIWRSENWSISNQVKTSQGSQNQFKYDSTGIRTELQYIPNSRFDLGTGFEYVNRQGSGGPPQLLINNLNAAKFLFDGSFRMVDERYQNRLHAEGYIARKGILGLGDLNYSAATVELNNRFLISKDSQLLLDWTLKGGNTWGQIPVEDYFVLGVDQHSQNLLRGHRAQIRGRYGNAPMGTSFGLANFNAERRIAIIPLFNSLNLPYLDLKAYFFLDFGKTWDRENIFKEGQLFVDTGGGLRIGLPTQTVSLLYGHSTQDGGNFFLINIEKRW